jgi:cytochrome P450
VGAEVDRPGHDEQRSATLAIRRPALIGKLARWLLSAAQRRRFDLSRLRLVPESLKMPLRRIQLDPDPALAALRAADPVSRLARFFGRDVWLVSGHAEVRAVLADPSSYSNDIRPLVGRDGSIPEQSIGGLGFTDAPDHTRLRRILTPQFTVRRLNRLRPRIAGIVEQQLDVIEAGGPLVDLVPTFAFPIPFLVICELLGLPDEDREEFRRIGQARFDVSQGGVPVFDAASESRAFLLTVTRKQREAPGDGLIGGIIKQYGDQIDDVELSGLADGVFTGGFETTASMLALGTLVLLQEPATYAALAADDQATDRAVEELLRYLSVVQVAFPRFARRHLELFGRSLAPGDVAACSLVGANRDPRLGEDMDRFVADRAPVSHLAFGHGVHRCVGAELARLELRLAYPALARRFPRMTLLKAQEELSFRTLSIVHAVDALPVRTH